MSESEGRMIRVAAGILMRKGSLLICQRRRRDKFPLKWEFPGGKLTPGESPRAALVRELREELGIGVLAENLRHLEQVEHHYPGGPIVRLDFFQVLSFHGDPVNLSFESFLWVCPEELRGFDFLEADRGLVARIANGRVFSGD